MPAAVEGLTRSQLAAVSHDGGPLIVRGAAGTGKTLVLERRFAWLAEEGAAPDSIVALSLSAGAAARMRSRVEDLVEPPYDELHVGTFRSFCERLLRDEAAEAGLDPAFPAVSAADRVALLLERLPDLTLRRHEIRGNPAPLMAAFVSRIDRLKEEMVSAEDLLAHAERELEDVGSAGDAARSRASREREFAQLYADHDRLLAERGALDSGELILRAFALLHQKPHARERVCDRFRHLLVDDLQDAGFAQASLLGLLGGHCEITVAGDPEQATRAGGDPEKNLADAERAFAGATSVVLEGHARRVTARGEAVSFWRCASERAQAQAVAAQCERLIGDGTAPEAIAVLVHSVPEDGPLVAAALEERAIAFRLSGPESYLGRPEVRDVLAWLRVLSDPSDSGAAVRALTRPPVGLHSVDVARLTQLARRRKLDMPAAVAEALAGPQLTPEGRDRAAGFLRLYRAASAAFEDRRPDAFVLRLIERIGIRRQQVFATQADTVERLRNVAKLPVLATAYMRREPGATTRGFTSYLEAVASSGLPPEDEAGPQPSSPVVEVLTAGSARGREFEHVFVLGLDAARMPGREAGADDVPEAVRKERAGAGAGHADRLRRVLHVAMSRASQGVVLAWSEVRDGAPVRPSPFVEELRAEREADEERFEEELFGPGEGLHSTFRIMRDELLDTVARVGGSLGEMRLDAGIDVSHAVARFLELVKVAAVIERVTDGQPVDDAIEEVNALLLQGATAEQREILATSALDDWLRDAGRDPELRPGTGSGDSEPTLDPFIPRRGEGLMLSASDIETYRLCPLKYKFARVFRIPQEATIHQRFGIVLHQVLERFHQHGRGSRQELMELFEEAWRRGGFGDSDDELQFRERAVAALERYWERACDDQSEPVWFERSFSFKLGEHVLRGRVDRVDRRPDGSYELIDYKTGKAKTEEQLREDIQLSIYQIGAREAWELETSAQSYLYVMTGEKVPVEHSEEQLERVRATVAQIGEGILRHDFRPTPTQEICSFCDYRIICPAAER